MDQLDAGFPRLVREARADLLALELDVLVVVRADSQVHAFQHAAQARPAAFEIHASLVEVDPHGLLLLTRDPVKGVERAHGDPEKSRSPSHDAADGRGICFHRTVRDDSRNLVAGVRARRDLLRVIGIREARDLLVVAVARKPVEVPSEPVAAAVEAQRAGTVTRYAVAA